MPQCGRPGEASSEKQGVWTNAWQAVEKTKTPINVFALAKDHIKDAKGQQLEEAQE